MRSCVLEKPFEIAAWGDRERSQKNSGPFSPEQFSEPVQQGLIVFVMVPIIALP